ncbi:sulfotransferase family 2 domain-containing protein [Pseudotabrizicola sp. 4114]|uniref:sulfotransferase family 2 domain-containing protein n=1 Tax=Pseudotabrizicola sp. 4114 TaxID=2817731 RepID=UPI0028627989|nr:hypothetical protein [Pseudorhodobacter sp. 4114]
MHIFLHIPKCGGSTIRQLYYQAFERVLLVQANGDIDTSVFPTLPDLNQYDAVIGHLQVRHMIQHPDALALNPVLHSVIRDPIDRLISLWNFIRVYPSHRLHAKAKQTTGVQFVMSQAQNQQAGFLGLGKLFDGVPDIIDRVTCVPLEHSVDYFSAYFSDRVPPTTERIKITNTTPQKKEFSINRDSFSEAQLSELLDRHATDLELLARCREAYDRTRETIVTAGTSSQSALRA